MKAKQVIYNSKDKLLIEEIELSETLPKSTLLVKVLFANVSGLDRSIFNGNVKLADNSSFGFEGIGEVVQGESEYGKLLVGTTVSFISLFMKDKTNSGSFAEYCIVNENMIIEIPDSLLENAENYCSFAGVVFLAFHILDYLVKPKNTGLLFDLGTSQLSKVFQFIQKEVFSFNYLAIVRSEERLTIVKKEGLDNAVNSNSKSFLPDLKALIAIYKPSLYVTALCDYYVSDILNLLPEESSICIIDSIAGGKLGGLSSIPLIHQNKDIFGLTLTLSAFEHSLEDNRSNSLLITQALLKGESSFLKKPKSIITVNELLESYKDLNENTIVKISFN